jgi:dihydrofolate reductase
VEFARNLKRAPDKDIWLVVGGEIKRLLLDHDLIDRIILTVFPIILGGGIPLFARGGKETAFRLLNLQHWEKTNAVK